MSARVQPARPGDPARIGPYRIVGRLGEGGMGTVHAALAPEGLRVAVKVIHPARAEDPEFRARFRREVELSARVTGPYLIPLLSAEPDAAAPWLATAYAPGPTLNQHLSAQGPLSVGSLYAFATGTAQALAAIHAADVVHRDVKPQNVILTPAGPRVLDFGIAHAADGTSVTRTGVMTGTPGWISPEHYRTGTAGPDGDMFAWGALVAYAATGRLPFGTGAPDVVAFRVISGDADLDGMPDGLRRIVEKTLAKEPEDRPTAAAVAEECSVLLAAQTTQVVDTGLEATMVGDLIAAEWHMPTLDDPAWNAPPTRSRARTIGIFLVVVAVVGGVVGGTVALAGQDTGSGTASQAPLRGNMSSATAPGTPGPAAGGNSTDKPKKNQGDGRASVDTWKESRPAQGSGEHDVARAVWHDTGVIHTDGIEVSPEKVTFHEARKEVYLAYTLKGDEAGRMYTETEVATAMCQTLQDVVIRLHPDLPYRTYVMVDQTTGRAPHVSWVDDFTTNTTCVTAADQQDAPADDGSWTPDMTGYTEATRPSSDQSEIRFADTVMNDLLGATNVSAAELGVQKIEDTDDIAVGFDKTSAMYVWNNHVDWSRQQIDEWSDMVAGRVCESLLSKRRVEGSAWPYTRFAIAWSGASGAEFTRWGTVEECAD
ncbi:serine/threonine-protein kinase [Streptomyces sp. NPDC005393]|uniref:serine/threonine-protein kinase n=1 Tax=Streptomyces sp. NPDC005393 TaxID=3157041 RepID=UPI0033B03EF3